MSIVSEIQRKYLCSGLKELANNYKLKYMNKKLCFVLTTIFLSMIQNSSADDKVVDPKTGYPVQKNILSSTVIASDCITTDSYATAFMVMGVEKALDVLAADHSIMAYFIIADEDSTQKYKVVYSEELKKVLKK